MKMLRNICPSISIKDSTFAGCLSSCLSVLACLISQRLKIYKRLSMEGLWKSHVLSGNDKFIVEF